MSKEAIQFRELNDGDRFRLGQKNLIKGTFCGAIGGFYGLNNSHFKAVKPYELVRPLFGKYAVPK